MVFFRKMALVVLNKVVFFILSNFVCFVTAVISVCIKKTSKLVNFCTAILILKIEENTQHFRHIMLYYFKKGKNATEMPKKDGCSVWGRCCAGRMCPKWFATFRTGDFSLLDAPQSGTAVEAESDHTET